VTTITPQKKDTEHSTKTISSEARGQRRGGSFKEKKKDVKREEKNDSRIDVVIVYAKRRGKEKKIGTNLKGVSAGAQELKEGYFRPEGGESLSRDRLSNLRGKSLRQVSLSYSSRRYGGELAKRSVGRSSN